jgi:Holliday junction resolvasome RuvABC endonuclease subunit
MERGKTENHKFTIMTNDPSMTNWGYCILTSDNKILTVGCVRTKTDGAKRRIRKGDETVHRVSEINQELIQVIKEYKVDFLLSELPHGSQSASAAVMIGIVAGIAQTLSNALNIPIEWYSEGDAKKAVLGKQSATKYEMKCCIDKLYNVPWTGFIGQDEHIADALAVHYAALKESPTLQLFRNGQRRG